MKYVIWVAAAAMLASAAMLVADVGASGLWFAVIAVGIAVVAIERMRSHPAS